MNRRTALGSLLCMPLLSGCYYDQYFDIVWDEEAKLHDSRVILVHLKFIYERQNRFSRYGRAMLRDTEMTFDAGPPHGRVTQVFRRVKPVMLDQVNGSWYVVLQGRSGASDPALSGQDWGPQQNLAAERAGVLGTTGFARHPLRNLPNELKEKNLLYDYAPVAELAKMNGKKWDLALKSSYYARYPLHPGHAKIW